MRFRRRSSRDQVLPDARKTRLSWRVSSPLLQAALLAGLALPYVVSLGASSLWDANEAFYAETPREMLESGNFLAPSFNYQPRAQKPPLTYWAVLACYKVFGVGEFGVRLPAALAAVGTILFVFGMGRLLYSPAAGLVSAAICATTPRFLVLARKLPIDALLLFWITGTAFFMLHGIVRRSRASWVAAYLFAGLGFMTKGPIALVVPCAAYLAWGLWSRRLDLRAAVPLPGLAVLLAVVLPWYALIYVSHGWTYIAGFFLRDNIGRFAAESFGPARGPLFYLPIYFADFFPWSLLSVAALVILWRERKSSGGLRVLQSGFPLFWCGLVLVMFSISKNKQEYYIASVYPMMSVLLGGVFHTSLADRDGVAGAGFRGTWTWCFRIVSALLLALSLTAVFTAGRFLTGAPAFLDYAAPAVLAATAIAVTWSVARRAIHWGMAWLGAGLWAVCLTVPLLYLPALESLRPVKDLCSRIAARFQPGDEAGYYRATVPSMVFYLRRPIFEEFEADSMVHRLQSPRRVLCIMTEQDHNFLVGRRDQILYVLDRRPRLVTRLRGILDDKSWAEQELLLVSNRPDPGASAPRREDQ